MRKRIAFALIRGRELKFGLCTLQARSAEFALMRGRELKSAPTA